MQSYPALRTLLAAIGLAAATLAAALHPVSVTAGDLVAPPFLGGITPIDYTVGRLRHDVDFLRERVGRFEQQAARDTDAAHASSDLTRARAQLDKDVARWVAALKTCTVECSTRDVRYGAQYDLLMHNWDATSQKERIARIDAFVDDKMALCGAHRPMVRRENE